MAVTTRPEAQRTDPLNDDYHVEGHGPATQATVGLHAIRILQGLLVIVLALLSIALFWMIALMLGLL